MRYHLVARLAKQDRDKESFRARAGWPKGRRRTDCPCDVSLFIRGLGSVRAVARAAGVSPRLVQFWRRGTKRPSLATLQRLIERLMPLTAGGSFLSGGISEEVLHSAKARVTGLGCGDYSRGINHEHEQ